MSLDVHNNKILRKPIRSEPRDMNYDKALK